MASVTFKGQPVRVEGELPAVGGPAPDFRLTDSELNPFGKDRVRGKALVLNIFPSIDTAVCATAAREFNRRAAALENTRVLCVSMDLPFALNRFCAAEGLEHVIPLSAFRSPEFGRDFGVRIVDSPMAGLLTRAVVVLDAGDRVRYARRVAEITDEPDYEAALAALRTP